jgi:uncharacterized protein
VTSGEKLCLACGLCCDGTLFDNVHLGPGDKTTLLQSLGLPIRDSRAKSPITHFRQPCTALCADRTCRIYQDRPRQCRDFECGVFKAAESGQITALAALRLVKRTRRQADAIRQLLRQLDDHDEERSLGDRFRRMQKRLESIRSDAAVGALFAELGLAVHAFNLLAHERFYTRAANP